MYYWKRRKLIQMAAPIIDISKLINRTATTEGVWVQFKDTTFRVQVTYFGKAELRSMFARTKKLEYDVASMSSKESIDEDKFRKEYSKNAIKAWEGLTIKVLSSMIPLDSDMPDDQEIACTDENKSFLIEHSVEFDQWITRNVQNVELFNKKKREEEEKN